MDSPRLDDAAGDHQPEGSSTNTAQHPSIDVTRTKLWVSVRDDIQLDLGTAVTHHNLEALAELIQGISGILLDLGKKIEKNEADNRIMKANLRTLLRASGEDDASEASRRSSMNRSRASLGSRTSSVGGTAGEDEDQNEDPADAALAKFLDKLETTDAYFESFILSSGKTPLIKHTKNLHTSSQAFKEAANAELAGFVGEQRANEMLEYLSLFGEKQLEEAYMAMSRRYKASKGKGKGKSKKASTVNEGFVTDVSGRGDGSQSTDLNSSRKTRSARAPKTPHRPRTRRAITVEPEDIDEE